MNKIVVTEEVFRLIEKNKKKAFISKDLPRNFIHGIDMSVSCNEIPKSYIVIYITSTKKIESAFELTDAELTAAGYKDVEELKAKLDMLKGPNELAYYIPFVKRATVYG